MREQQLSRMDIWEKMLTELIAIRHSLTAREGLHRERRREGERERRKEAESERGREREKERGREGDIQ